MKFWQITYPRRDSGLKTFYDRSLKQCKTLSSTSCLLSQANFTSVFCLFSQSHWNYTCICCSRSVWAFSSIKSRRKVVLTNHSCFIKTGCFISSIRIQKTGIRNVTIFKFSKILQSRTKAFFWLVTHPFQKDDRLREMCDEPKGHLSKTPEVPLRIFDLLGDNFHASHSPSKVNARQTSHWNIRLDLITSWHALSDIMTSTMALAWPPINVFISIPMLLATETHRSGLQDATRKTETSCITEMENGRVVGCGLTSQNVTRVR